MGRFRKVALAVYLLASAIVVGGFAGSLFGPFTGRFARLLATPWIRMLVVVCLLVLCVHMLVTVVRMIADRPEPECIRLGGNPDIEVSLEALASMARVAAADRDVMVEEVRARVSGREREQVRIKIDAIAFTDQGLEGLAHRVQQRVADACASMLGVDAASVCVRFLPSKTVTVTKEGTDE